MPELPEVETVRRSLEMALPGHIITDICVREPRLRFTVNEAELTDLILRRKVVALRRRAKYLIIHFSKGSCLIVHLGMTGQVLILPAADRYASISAGDIVWLAGPDEIGIGDTFSASEEPEAALKPLDIEEPTVSMFFLINNGPFSGSEGTAITLRQLKDRLTRELRVNVALRMEDQGQADGLKVSGRGELHLAILIEEMRREGLEFCVSRPEVIIHQDSDGNVLEPIEQLIMDVPEEYQGVIIEKLARRKGDLKTIENAGTNVIRIEFEISTRGLIGYRSEFLTDTRGLGIMTSRFMRYDAWRGEINLRNRGSVVSMDTGSTTAYALEGLQERTVTFVEPGERVYGGQIVGENSRTHDFTCNPTKRKNLTNHRSSTKDIAVTLDVPRKMSLEQAIAEA